MPQPTWGDELRNYEREKRYTVDEGLLRGPQTRISCGQVAFQSRTFDPLLQRYRDGGTEATQRLAEEKERVAHLNRAADVQILREQPFHIINGESKVEALAPGQDPMRLGGGPTLGQSKRSAGPNGSYPTTAIGYNLLSNMPFQDHHWAKPEDRPHIKERELPVRKVPQNQVKEFNIVNNRYLERDAEKKARDKHQELANASAKYMKQSLFDPIVQQFDDPMREEGARVAEHAALVESTMRAQAQMPPCIRARESAHYDVLTHKVHNKDMIKLHDDKINERKDRKQNRYIVEHNQHLRDIKADHIRESRLLNRIAPERYEEMQHRGYDIIDNRPFGSLSHKERVMYEPYAKKRMTPWEKATLGRPETGLSASSSAVHLRTAASTRSAPAPGAAERPTMARSASTPSVRAAPPGQTMPAPFAAPPAPSIPGSSAGSVYSRSRR